MHRSDELAEVLATRKHWFFDLDGTVHLGGTPLPGALELVRTLHDRSVGVTYVTNNSSRSSRDYRERLAGMGFPLGPHGVVSSGLATGLWLREARADARVFLLGTPALAGELESLGVTIVEDAPDTVVVGYDTSLRYDRLARACLHLRAGAHYVATHADVNCPTPDGPVPDAGSFVALIEASTGRAPDRVVGKPNVEVLRQAAASAGVALRDCVMVGDRLETDMAMAQRAGIPGVLVLTGVTSGDDPRLGERSWHRAIHVAAGAAELHARLTSGS